MEHPFSLEILFHIVLASFFEVSVVYFGWLHFWVNQCSRFIARAFFWSRSDFPSCALHIVNHSMNFWLSPYIKLKWWSFWSLILKPVIDRIGCGYKKFPVISSAIAVASDIKLFKPFMTSAAFSVWSRYRIDSSRLNWVAESHLVKQ